MNYVLGFLLVVTSVFMIMLILIQRGRGGGLAGALGGAGGQSAFGTKAGDLFTRITMGVAIFWIILCALSLKINNTSTTKFAGNLGSSADKGDSTLEAPKFPRKATDKNAIDDKSSTGLEKPASGSKSGGEKPAAEKPASSEKASGDKPAESPDAKKPVKDAKK